MDRDTLNAIINYLQEKLREISVLDTEQTDGTTQTELQTDNTRIFDYILVKQVNKKNVDNKGILKLDRLKSLNTSNATKQLLEQQDNHDNHAKTAFPMNIKNAIKILVDLQKRNSDWMFEMIYNDKKKVAYYFRLKKSPNYTTKELIDGNSDYPHNYYSFETN